jgi:RNA polymerase sigma-70 factor (ECF subfamily)
MPGHDMQRGPLLRRVLSRSDTDGDITALLVAVGRGDRDALRTLYARTSPKLFGIVLRIVRDRPLAEEVLQDVFLRIWLHASAYSSDIARPTTWLVSVARNRAIDVVRLRREVLMAPGPDGEDWMDLVADPRQLETEIVSRESLLRCLGELDEAQRHCVVLAYRDGYSREELAARFDRPVNTIKTWLHRSLAALRTCLDS